MIGALIAKQTESAQASLSRKRKPDLTLSAAILLHAKDKGAT